MIFFKGYGPDPYCYVARRAEDGIPRFGGASYLVESYSDLEKASTLLPGASASDISKLDAITGQHGEAFWRRVLRSRKLVRQ